MILFIYEISRIDKSPNRQINNRIDKQTESYTVLLPGVGRGGWGPWGVAAGGYGVSFGGVKTL